ncbi:phosphatidylglycerol/phosphatidylinositol transfer protein [Histoplasma ohiense]|nr:phosphatidylglycerol/phosphatidylinositol transfer protein [Histoplasma ohiense (nom. inval.)]
MRLTTSPVLILLWSSLAVGFPSMPWSAKDQAPIMQGSKMSVPGENPFNYCFAPDHDILTIKKVDLDPPHPMPGKTLTVNASGTFHEEVAVGSMARIQVKYGLIRLINQEVDLCEQIEAVDMHCPIKKGDMVFLKSIELPKEIPPGKYTVLADVFTEGKDQITCIEAQITF